MAVSFGVYSNNLKRSTRRLAGPRSVGGCGRRQDHAGSEQKSASFSTPEYRGVLIYFSAKMSTSSRTKAFTLPRLRRPRRSAVMRRVPANTTLNPMTLDDGKGEIAMPSLAIELPNVPGHYCGPAKDETPDSALGLCSRRSGSVSLARSQEPR